MTLVLDDLDPADMAVILDSWKEDVRAETRTTRAGLRLETERFGAIAADREAAIMLSNDLNESFWDDPMESGSEEEVRCSMETPLALCSVANLHYTGGWLRVGHPTARTRPYTARGRACR